MLLLGWTCRHAADCLFVSHAFRFFARLGFYPVRTFCHSGLHLANRVADTVERVAFKTQTSSLLLR